MDMGGAHVGTNGAATIAINQSVAARGMLRVPQPLTLSPSFAFSYARAARWAEASDTSRGVLIGDHGNGGLMIEGFNPEDANRPNGRNQNYWLRENARLCAEFDVALTCPYHFHFQGTSAKTQIGADYIAAFDAAFDPLVAEVEALTGQAPKIVMVVNGGDVRTIGDRYDTPVAQYELTLARGGIVGTWQRTYKINDGNIHIDAAEKVLIGETCAWAVEVVEGGGVWSVTYSVVKVGVTVTVTFDLMPGETLMERADLYDDFGGDATCPHYGFEADGGIVSVVADLDGNTVTITLANSAAGWLSHALQVQDCMAMVDAQGYGMSAHRSTLFGSVTRPSRFVAGETLWRPVPGFRVEFERGA